MRVGKAALALDCVNLAMPLDKKIQRTQRQRLCSEALKHRDFAEPNSTRSENDGGEVGCRHEAGAGSSRRAAMINPTNRVDRVPPAARQPDDPRPCVSSGT
jgi:hypothetical protein